LFKAFKSKSGFQKILFISKLKMLTLSGFQPGLIPALLAKIRLITAKRHILALNAAAFVPKCIKQERSARMIF